MIASHCRLHKKDNDSAAFWYFSRKTLGRKDHGQPIDEEN
jgi:hypothetical protein